MNHKLLILLSFLITFTISAQEEQEEYSFSLQEAINFALENNRTAQNASRDIEAAEKQKWETTATGLPQLNAAVDYQNLIKQQFEAVDFNQDGIPDFGAKHSVNASATLSQLIFDGSYLVGLQSAKVYLQISENAKTKTDLEVRKGVIDAYGNVLLAEESITILNRNIETLTKNLNETRKIYENGFTEEESVEQLQITLSSVQSNLNNVERLKALAYKMLNFTLGLDIDDKVTLTDNLETLTAKNISLELIENSGTVENTIDYKIAENNKVSKELLLKLEKSKALPSLNAFLSGAYIGNNNEFKFLTDEQKWIGTATFGASLKIPIFSSGMRSASTQRAQINLEKAEADLIDTEQQLKLQIANAKSEYQFAIEEYNNKKENLNLAERIEQKNQVKFFEGISTSFELRQAQTQLYTAQQEFLQAMLDVINKKAALETITNQIIEN